MDDPIHAPRDRRQGRGRRVDDDPTLRQSHDRVMVRVSHDVHALRERQGWSQETLARAAGVARSTVQDVEKATGDPCLTTLERLYFVLGYEISITIRIPVALERPAIPG